MSKHPFRFSQIVVALVALTLLSVAAPGLAQKSRLELSPMLTYSFGTGFEVDDFEFGRLDLDLDDSSGFGLLFDIPVSRNLQVELLYLRQDTELVLDEGLLTPSFPLSDIQVETYHAGILWQVARGQLRPFFVLTGGISTLDLRFAGADTETELSLSVGAGVKAFFTDHFGLRAEGRLLVIDLGEEGNRGCCYDYQDNSIAQGVVSAGLLFAF